MANSFGLAGGNYKCDVADVARADERSDSSSGDLSWSAANRCAALRWSLSLLPQGRLDVVPRAGVLLPGQRFDLLGAAK